MASTLAFMHENGVAYNGIKPGNILFTPAHGAVPIDFGLSSDDAVPAPPAAIPDTSTDWQIWAVASPGRGGGDREDDGVGREGGGRVGAPWPRSDGSGRPPHDGARAGETVHYP